MSRRARAVLNGVRYIGAPMVRLKSCRAGASAVEFALVAPVFLAMALGTVEFGRLFWIRHTLQYAAEETGRFATVNSTATAAQLEERARQSLAGLDQDKVAVVTTAETLAGVDYLIIEARYQFHFISGLIGTESMALEGRSRVPLI